ncbi:MAG: hypothetical protein HON07_05230 [Planctomycetaceae bacterium]|jgi:hypothetical protein|nr:hypothetical protein [Planctomycetaceae bacterium]
MRGQRYGVTTAVKEHLAEGRPISRLEALALYGVSNLTDVVSELRKQGWVIESRRIPFAKAVARVNEYAVFQPPKNLPIKEIQLTEYWMNR